VRVGVIDVDLGGSEPGGRPGRREPASRPGC